MCYKRKRTLNENREELRAQSVSKSALFRLRPKFEELFDYLQELGFIESYRIRINPHNRGYEMTFNQKRTDKILTSPSETEYFKIIANLIEIPPIHIQPDTFFQHNLEERKESRMTGWINIFDDEDDHIHIRDVSWIYKVGNKNDIKEAGNEFVQLSLEFLNEAISILEEYESDYESEIISENYRRRRSRRLNEMRRSGRRSINEELSSSKRKDTKHGFIMVGVEEIDKDYFVVIGDRSRYIYHYSDNKDDAYEWASRHGAMFILWTDIGGKYERYDYMLDDQ